MNKKGFTLMELLLVVAILAIVAAAAAPTFTSGAADALNEARKSSFLGAYQNTVTGIHLMVALAASKGVDIPAASELDTYTYTETGSQSPSVHALSYYAPLSTRSFKTKAGNIYYLSAKINNNKEIEIYPCNATENNGSVSVTPVTGTNAINMTSTTSKDASKTLSAAWDEINAL